MIYRVTITLLTLASIAQVHAASQETEWPIRIHISKPGRDSLYYIQSALPTPYAPTTTLGQRCQLAHGHNLPWCFYIATFITRSRKTRSRTQTCYFDAAVIHKCMQPHGIHDDEEPYLQQVVNLIAPDRTRGITTAVDLVAFNHYPDGLTTMLDPDQENQLGLQLGYTMQLYDKKEDVVPISFRQLVYNYSKRHNRLSFEQFWGERTDAEEVTRAAHEARFWVARYMQDPAMIDNETDKALSAIQAFRVLKKD